MLPSCDGQSDSDVDLCPGRNIGIHDLWCKYWKLQDSIADVQVIDMHGPTVWARGGAPDAEGGKHRNEDVVYPEHASKYELTLTHIADDPHYLRQVLAKIVNSAMFEIVYWEAVLELQKNGMPHIHAMLMSKRKFLDATKIKNPKGIGFPHRYELKKIRMFDNYLDYMKKDIGNDVVTKYCNEKGIPQYWKYGDVEKAL